MKQVFYITRFRALRVGRAQRFYRFGFHPRLRSGEHSIHRVILEPDMLITNSRQSRPRKQPGADTMNPKATTLIFLLPIFLLSVSGFRLTANPPVNTAPAPSVITPKEPEFMRSPGSTESSTNRDSPKIRDVLQAHGLIGERKIETLILNSMITMSFRGLPTEVEQEEHIQIHPLRFRKRTALPMALVEYGFDGERAWFIGPDGDRVLRVPRPRMEAELWSQKHRWWYLLCAKDLEYIALEPGDQGQKRNRVFENDEHLGDISLTEANLIGTLTFDEKDLNGSERTLLMRFSDYRMIDGISFPHRFTTFLGDEVIQDTRVTRVQINPIIHPEDFESP